MIHLTRRFPFLFPRVLALLVVALLGASALLAGCGGGGGGGGTSGGGGGAASSNPAPDPGASPPAPPALQVPEAASAWVEGVVLVRQRPVSGRMLDGEALGRASGLRLKTERRFPGLDLERLRILSGESVQEAVKRLETLPQVVYAEPDYLVKADEVVPNDPRFSEQWALKNSGAGGGLAGADVEATLAWDTTTGSPQVVVAVIDTGTDYTHPDLAANMWVNPGETAGNGIDDDGNGFVDDRHGINAMTGTGNPMDDEGHGTHVSGIVAAVANNGTGVSGVAPGVRIMSLKFLDAEGSGSISDAVTCLDYAVNKGARVANASWGSSAGSQAFQDALARARAAGLLLVCAAGNEASDNDAVPHFPSNYEDANVLAVGNMTRSEAVAGTSNYGLTTVDLFAPGSAILSTIPGSAYASYSGTSMASPHVAGVAALLLSANPSQSYMSVRSRILSGVETFPAYSGRCVTGGRLNARLALAAPIPTVVLTSLAPGAGRAGSSITLEGQGFGASRGTGSVQFGTSAITSVTSWSDTRVVLAVPQVSPGAYAVRVNTASGAQSNSLSYLVDSNLQYVESATTHDFRSIATTGQALTLSDDSAQVVNLGFTFTYYGEAQTSVTVASNGYLTFGGDGTAFQNMPIPSTGQPNRLVAPLWTDLDPGTRGTVHVQTRGIAPNREFVAQWTGVPHFPDTGDATFQAVLREAQGDVLFHYQDATFGNATHDGGASATIGVESPAGSSGAQHSGTVADGTSLRFAPTGAPGPSPSPSPSPSPVPGLESLPLASGWNCVSFPVASLTQVQLGAGVGKVFVFDGAQQQYTLLTPTAANFNAGAGMRRGFWIYSSANSQIDYAGVDNDGSLRTVDLQTGWNLVGAPHRQALLASEILVTDLSTTPNPAAVPFGNTLSAAIPAPSPFLLFRYVSDWRSGRYDPWDGQAANAGLAPKLGHWIYAWKPVRLEFQALGTNR